MDDRVLDVIGGRTFQRTEYVGCPLCGVLRSPRRIDVKFGLTAMVAECPSCHVAFQTPRPSVEASTAYMTRRWSDSDRYVADSDAQTARARKQLRVVHSVRQPPGTLLDFGAGAGAFVAAARDGGWTATGVEQSATAIARARALHAITLSEAVPRGQFDVITLWDVIEHLRDPEHLLSTLRSTLAPRGRIFVETGNYQSWLRLLKGDAWGLYLFDHQYYFTPGSLAALMTRVGFRDFRLLRSFCARVPRLRHARRLGEQPLRVWAKWAEAKIRWPRHGDVNIMIATAINL